MATIGDFVVLDGRPAGAPRPLVASDISFLKDGLAGAAIALIDREPEIEKVRDGNQFSGCAPIVRRELIGQTVNFQQRDRAGGLATIGRNVVEGAFNGGKGRYLVAQCTGNTVGHAGPDGVASRVDAMRIQAVVFLDITNDVASKLHIVGQAGRAARADACVPAGLGLRYIVVKRALGKNNHKMGFIGFRRHVGVVLKI